MCPSHVPVYGPLSQVEELQAVNAELNSTIQRFSLELRPLTTSRDGHVNDRGLARQRMQASSKALPICACLCKRGMHDVLC